MTLFTIGNGKTARIGDTVYDANDYAFPALVITGVWGFDYPQCGTTQVLPETVYLTRLEAAESHVEIMRQCYDADHPKRVEFEQLLRELEGGVA